MEELSALAMANSMLRVNLSLREIQSQRLKKCFAIGLNDIVRTEDRKNQLQYLIWI